MSDFTPLELLKGHARICPPQVLEQYNKGVALVENGSVEEGVKLLRDIAFDYGEPTYDMPIWNDKLIGLLVQLKVI